MSSRTLQGLWLAAMPTACALLILLWPPAPLTLPTDDAFYVLTIARHAALGHGFSFDGVHATNGFHPLWGVVLVPLAALFGGDVDRYVRVVLLTQTMLVAGALAMLIRFAPRPNRSLAACACALFFTQFYFTKIFINGLESALQLAAIATCIAAAQAAATSMGRLRWSLALGLAASACVLARLSAVLFAAPFLVLELRRERSTAARMVATGAFAAPLGAYFAHNLHRFGHVLPVNAMVKAMREGGPLHAMHVAAFLGQLAFAVVALRVVRRRTQRVDVRRNAAWALALYVAVQGAHDALVRKMVIAEIWYLVPHATLLLLALALVDWDSALRSHRSAAIAAASLWVAGAVTAGSLRARPASYTPYVAARQSGEWLREHMPSGARAAGWDCGIVGAFSGGRVANLDGLANSTQFFDRYLSRDDVGSYLRDEHIDFIAQPVPLGLLARGVTQYRGVELESLAVMRAQCVHFEPVLRKADDDVVHLVLARSGDGPTLRASIPTLLARCASTSRAP